MSGLDHEPHRSLWWPVGLLMALLGVAPLCYNGGAFTWYPAAGIILSLAGLAWCCVWTLRVRPHGLRLVPGLHLGLPLLLFLIPIAVGALQLLPAYGWLKAVSPWVAGVWSAVPEATPRLTIAPADTVQSILLLAIGMLTCLFCITASRYARMLSAITTAMIAAGVAVAAIGLFEMLASPDGTGNGISVCKGVFQNRNHFGFFVNIALLMLAGKWSEECLDNASHGGPATRFPMKTAAIGMAAFIMVIALFASLSRGAALGLVAGCAVLLLSSLAHRRKNGRGAMGANAVIVAVLVLGGLLLALPAILARLFGRFNDLLAESIADDARSGIWRSTCELICGNWLAGVGLGGYPDAIQHLNSVPLSGAMVVHAHNDWLELTAEIGVPAMLILLALTGCFLCRTWKGLALQDSQPRRCMGDAALAALAACAVHECLDFNLHAGPCLVAFAALLGILQGCSMRTGGWQDGASLSRRRFTAPGVLFALAMGVFLAFNLMRLPGAWHNDLLWTRLNPGDEARQRAVSVGAPSAGMLALAEKTCRQRPGDPAAMLRQARLLYRHATAAAELTAAQRSQALAQADTLLADSRRRAPLSSQVILWQGIVAESLGRWDDAMDRYWQTVESAPTVTRFRQLFAEAALRDFSRRPAETRRMRALTAYATWLESDPASVKAMLPYLVRLCTTAGELTQHCPLTAEVMPWLFNAMIMQCKYADAHGLLGKFADGDTVKASPQWQLKCAEWELQLEILRGAKGPEMAAAREKWRQAMRKAFSSEVDDLLAEYHGNADDVPDELLKALSRRHGCENPEAALHLAQKCRNRGQAGEMVAALMPFAYASLVPPSPEQLARAAKMLETPLNIPEDMKTRAAFLANALEIRGMLEEGEGARPAPPALEKAVDALATLQREIDAGRRGGWYQEHLTSLYIAMGAIRMNDPALAISAAEKCLAQSPHNARAARLLRALGGDAAPPDHESAGSDDAPPLSMLAPGVLLRSVALKAPPQNDLSMPLEAQLHLECLGTVPQSGKVLVALEDARGVFARKTIPFSAGGRNPLRWKDGETTVLSCVFDLPLVAQIQAHGKAEPYFENIFVSISAAPDHGRNAWGQIPPVLLHAYPR